MREENERLFRFRFMIAEVIQDVSKSEDMKEQGEDDSRVVFLRVAKNEALQKENPAKGQDESLVGEVSTKRVRMAQLDDVKAGNDEVQGNDSEMEGISPYLREHIEEQLTSASPIFNCGETALHRAAHQGLAGVLARLLAACPFLINVPESSGWTAFHSAADAGHTAIVAQLLAVNPALIDAKANDGSTAFHLAALKDHAAIVAQLLAVNPALIDARTGDGRTGLHLAAESGAAAVVALILAASPISIDAKENGGRTALHLAAHAGCHEVVAQLLAANPASIEAMTNDGRTVLHCAFSGREKTGTIVAQLLAAKPSLIDAIINDADSWNALQNLVKVDHAEAVARLLSMHPELIHKTSWLGWTVFHEAAFLGSNKVMSHLLAAVTQPDLEQLLLRRTTGLLGSNEGSTALHVAARKGHSSIVTQLLAACPSLVDVLDNEGQTCLHSAVCEFAGSPESTMEVLLAFKPALLHAVDARGNTVLHLLIRSQPNNKELIEKVLKMNPEALHAANCDGDTPFHSVVAAYNANLIDLLQWSVTFDEIVNAYSKYGQSYGERFKPLMELQCEELAVKLLPDVVATVFDYLGFARGLLRDEHGPLLNGINLMPICWFGNFEGGSILNNK